MSLSGMSRYLGDLIQISDRLEISKQTGAWMHVSKNFGYISIDSAIFKEVDDYNRIMLEINNKWETIIYIGFKKFKNWDDSVKGVVKCKKFIPSQSEMDRVNKVINNDPEELL